MPLTGCDALVYVKLSSQRHLTQCHICIQNVIIERMTLSNSLNMHKISFIFMIWVLSWLWRCHVSLINN